MSDIVRFAMWWVPTGHLPTAAEAIERLEHLTIRGPGDYDFGWESQPNVQGLMAQRCA